MILATPYYDPRGDKYNQSLAHQLPALQTNFSSVCLSVVPPTGEDNAEFLKYLEAQGCRLGHNPLDSQHGTHSRTALQLGVQCARTDEPIFFGFLDRILFALETKWCDPYLKDLEDLKTHECILFERSELAWETHPANFREVEQMLSRMFQWMSGEWIDLMPCALLFSPQAAATVLSQSISPGTAVWAEWVLLAMKNWIPIERRKVDWLAWKDPFWERTDPETLKHARENSRAEMVKRINMNVPAMLMLAEERFKDLCKPPQQALSNPFSAD